MQVFTCAHCGQMVYFENSHCVRCGFPLGFVPEALQVVSLVKKDDGLFTIYQGGKDISYQYCANSQYGVCNWLVEATDRQPYCKACALNRTIPNLTEPQYRQRWTVIEEAKHYLVYALLRMGLALFPKNEHAEQGLGFDFLADESKGNDGPRVLTGHDRGLITLNIAEADDIEREMARKSMDEPYRTVLGHFRHEVGHYYWDRLIADGPHLEEYRRLFGDEQMDYGEAVKRHYEEGAPKNWNEEFISAYATTHPWEDWAESWAHYMHLLDTLETAYAFGLAVHPKVPPAFSALVGTDIRTDPYELADFSAILEMWLPFTFAMNRINRSMGQRDLYPFVIAPKAVEKLAFVHRVCFEKHRENREPAA